MNMNWGRCTSDVAPKVSLALVPNDIVFASI
jgi:hypothetical protein